MPKYSISLANTQVQSLRRRLIYDSKTEQVTEEQERNTDGVPMWNVEVSVPGEQSEDGLIGRGSVYRVKVPAQSVPNVGPGDEVQLINTQVNLYPSGRNQLGASLQADGIRTARSPAPKNAQETK